MAYQVSWQRAYRLADERHQSRVAAAQLARGSAVQAAPFTVDSFGNPVPYASVNAAIAAADAAYANAVTSSGIQRQQDVAAITAAKANLGPGTFADPIGAAAAVASIPGADVVAV